MPVILKYNQKNINGRKRPLQHFVRGMFRTLLFVFCIVQLSSFQQAKAIGNKGMEQTQATVNHPNNLSAGVVSTEGDFIPRALKIEAELRTPVDTRLSKVRDIVTAQTTTDLLIGDYILIPANSFLHGYISKLDRPGKFFKAPKVEFQFDHITLSGKRDFKELKVSGTMRQKQIMQKSEKVSYTTPFRTKAAGAALAGGSLATAGMVGFISAAEPFATFGMQNTLRMVTYLGTALGGAAVGASLVTRDDIRIEPGTMIDVYMDQPTFSDVAMDDTNRDPDFEVTTEDEASLEEQYDELIEIKAEEI